MFLIDYVTRASVSNPPDFLYQLWTYGLQVLLLYSSALHQHTDDKLPGTDVTMPRMRGFYFINTAKYIQKIEFQKLFLFFSFMNYTF